MYVIIIAFLENLSMKDSLRIYCTYFLKNLKLVDTENFMRNMHISIFITTKFMLAKNISEQLCKRITQKKKLENLNECILISQGLKGTICVKIICILDWLNIFGDVRKILKNSMQI